MVGKRLRELRESKGWGLRELARRAGVNPSTVSTAENGQHSLSLANAKKIADALGVRVGDLLDKEGRRS
jgi:transcriptional regulator with XRE-family HTH domain